MTIRLKDKNGSVLSIHNLLTFGNQRAPRNNYFLVLEDKDIGFYYEKINNKKEVVQKINDYRNQGFKFLKLKHFYFFLFNNFKFC